MVGYLQTPHVRMPVHVRLGRYMITQVRHPIEGNDTDLEHLGRSVATDVERQLSGLMSFGGPGCGRHYNVLRGAPQVEQADQVRRAQALGGAIIQGSVGIYVVKSRPSVYADGSNFQPILWMRGASSQEIYRYCPGTGTCLLSAVPGASLSRLVVAASILGASSSVEWGCPWVEV